MSLFLCILARVLLSSHSVFSQTLSTMAQKINVNEQEVWSTILGIWTTKMCNVSQPEQRKLLGKYLLQVHVNSFINFLNKSVGLALTNLLTTQSRPVYEKFDAIIVNILETLNDITIKQVENGVTSDSLVLTEGRSPSYFNEDNDSYYETDHDQRKKQLILSDPVHNIVLRDYLQSQVICLFLCFFKFLI